MEKAEKKKKRKSLGVADGAEGDTKEEPQSTKKLTVEVDEAMPENKSKKRKRDETKDSTMEVDAPVKEKKKKSTKDVDSMEVDVIQETAVDGQVKEKKKKSKSSKKHKGGDSTAVNASGTDAGTEKKSKREDKYKREKEKREKKRQAKQAVGVTA
jgi:hypothetical protein